MKQHKLGQKFVAGKMFAIEPTPKEKQDASINVVKALRRVGAIYNITHSCVYDKEHDDWMWIARGYLMGPLNK